MLIHGACPHDCPDTCGIITKVENGRAVSLTADPDHPITDGWLCAKVRPYLDHVYHPERLTTPLRRVSKKSEPAVWQEISWDEALAEIASRWRDIIDRFGAEAILPYSYSGTLGVLQLAVAGGRFWNRLGASRLDRAICCEAASAAVLHTVGAKHAPPYEQVLDSQLVVIWGHNPVSTAPHFMPFLKRAQRRGTQVVVIDPRRTKTAKGADWHLAPRPATDGALAMGLAHVIFAEQLHDEPWLDAHTVGWRAYREHVRPFTPQHTADITGLDPDEIVKLARLYATTQPALLKFADGINRHQNGGQICRALSVLPALTGQYGVRGGGLAYATSGYIQWHSETIEKWGVCPTPPGRWINMNQLGAALNGDVDGPPIQSLFVFAANPLASTPNAGLIRQGLLRDDLFTVVHELFMTDTAELADLVLPATSQIEQIDLHRAYGHTLLTLNEAAIPPLGECRSNWDVMRGLATALDFEEPWLHQAGEAILDELLEQSAAVTPELRGISVKTLRDNRGALALDFKPEVPFADGRFPTPSGKIEIYSQALADAGHAPLPTYEPLWDGDAVAAQFDPAAALTLLSGAAHHFVSSSFGNSPHLRGREREFIVEIHPHDAAARAITNGDLVQVANRRGCITLTAVVTEDVRPGVVSAPKGSWAKHHPDGKNINWLTPDSLADFAGQATFHSNWVWIKKC